MCSHKEVQCLAQMCRSRCRSLKVWLGLCLMQERKNWVNSSYLG